MNLFGRIFTSIITFLGLRRCFKLKDNLPVTDKGLLIQRCGYRPDALMNMRLTQIRSVGMPIIPGYTGVNTSGLMTNGNGCIDYTWTSLAGECKQDPGQTFKIEIKYAADPDNSYNLIGYFNCRGQRIG